MNLKSEVSQKKGIPEWVLEKAGEKIALVDVTESPCFAESKKQAEIIILYNPEMQRINVLTDEKTCWVILDAFEKADSRWIGGVGMIWPSDNQEIDFDTAKEIYHFVAGVLEIDSADNF